MRMPKTTIRRLMVIVLLIGIGTGRGSPRRERGRTSFALICTTITKVRERSPDGFQPDSGLGAILARLLAYSTGPALGLALRLRDRPRQS